MTDYPNVSVVTITYGHEDYITKTIDSVLMQKYRGEIEFIIANDNSPDDTDKVLSNYFSQKKIPDNVTIKYTKHKINKGAVSNFSWAVAQASGKYIALCEGDDYWIDSLKLQKQINFLEGNEDYSLCFTAKLNVNHKGDIINLARFNHQKSWAAEDVLDGGFIAGLQTIVSKNLSNEFNEFCCQFPDRTGVDRLYSYFYGIKGKLKYLDFESAAYRTHEGGIWSPLSAEQKLVAHITQHLKFLEVIKKDDSDFKKLRNNMFRLTIKDNYFKFYKYPSKTMSDLFFILKQYKISPIVFLLAGKDYLSYYIKLAEAKFRNV
ncbi:glycosyltransferase family 2 protein [Chryseobacterium sp. MP_3.2]|uniref:glycosyltransferase family 2 protein n=1 Tax=Chryseobacterium sp. MP_3.2 TaxID=3071712 RepID=UPI002E03A008|nr:glycosyltransferase involved in cell wall biosynthesis [Chryseobacterium sp. MP_3.2]